MTKAHRAALGLLLGVVACTGSSGAPPSTVPAPTTTTVGVTTSTIPDNEAVAGFVNCLRDAGLDVPDITADATGRPRVERIIEQLDLDDVSVAATYSGCAPLLAAGPLANHDDPALRKLVMGQLSGFAECMRRHGVEEFPDPLPGFSGVGEAFPAAEIPFADLSYPEALGICTEVLIEMFDE